MVVARVVVLIFFGWYFDVVSFLGVWKILQVPESMMTSQMKNPKQEHSIISDGTQKSWASENAQMGFWAKTLCTHRKNPLYRYPHFSNKNFWMPLKKNTSQSLTSRLLKRNHSLAGLKLLNLGFVSHTFLWTWKVHDRHDPSQRRARVKNSALMNHGISKWVIY